MLSKSEKIAISQIKTFCENGHYDFKHPLQRSAEQWNKEQKSLLIDSLFRDYPIDAVTLACKDENADLADEGLYSIDGTQRITSIRDYIDNRFRLSKNLEPVDGKEIANKRFKELDEKLQNTLLSKSIDSVELYHWKDEELAKVFMRKNNGKPLTSSQKQSVNYSEELYLKLLDITNLDEKDEKGKAVKNFWNRFISKSLRKNAEDRTLVMESMMLIDKALLERDGSLTTDFKAASISEYIDKFQNYSSDVQDKLTSRVINASNELNKQFSTLEQQIKDAKKAIKAAAEGDDISQYENIIKTNKARIKNVKKLTVPMLVAGMSRVLTSKEVGVEYYMNNVYALLDFIAELSSMDAEKRNLELAINSDYNSDFVEYYNAYNTSGTADKANVNARWRVFMTFTKKAKDETKKEDKTEDSDLEAFMNAPDAN